eukprot:scaffold48750_cov35-Tisochrysis_lutea.AAC.2
MRLMCMRVNASSSSATDLDLVRSGGRKLPHCGAKRAVEASCAGVTIVSHSMDLGGRHEVAR